MSSMPPNMPPGGGQPPYPPPGYPGQDPKTQWRIHREQQRAAWRAQRDAWKAQRQAMRAGYISTYGPKVPSVVGPIVLIAVGIIAFLVAVGRVNFGQFMNWYGHWWPLLLIAAGLALLGEWALDLRRKTPVRRGGSYVGILILLAIVGIGATGWSNWWGPFRAQFGNDGDDFFNSFGQPEHDLDEHSTFTQIPANAAVEIQDPRGDVSITAADVSTIEVEAHQVAYASSDSEAKKIFAAQAPHITVSGSSVLVKSEGNGSGRLNLTITVPKSARVNLDSGKGDITASGLGSGIRINARGDVHLSDITGPVDTRFSDGKHDFTAHQINGDITLDGQSSDLTLSEIKGRVSQNGQISGDVHMESISGPIHLHTTVTDLQLGELPGDLTLDSDDLHVTQAKGQVRVTTHSKDVDLSQIYGDTFVEDRDGRINIEPAGSYSVNAKNGKGDVEITLPPNTSASVDARTHNGDIVSDFSMPNNADGANKVVTFNIGAGGVKLTLNADNGDVRIKKGTGFPALLEPAAPRVPSPPKVPPAPGATRLKSQKALPPQPVVQ